MVLTAYSSATASALAIPTGWDKRVEAFDAVTGTRRTAIYTRVWQPGDAAPTISGLTSGNAWAQIHRIQDADTIDLIAGTSTGSVSNSSGPIPLSSFTPDADDCLILMTAGYGQTAATNLGVTAGGVITAEVTDVLMNGAGTVDDRAGVWTGPQTTAAATGTINVNVTSGAASCEGSVCAIAIRPRTAINKIAETETGTMSTVATHNTTHNPGTSVTPHLVTVEIEQHNGGDEVSGVTYDGVAMTRVRRSVNTSGNPDPNSYLYELLSNISAGSVTVAITSTGTSQKRAWIRSYEADGGTLARFDEDGANGTTGTPSVAVSTPTNRPSLVTAGICSSANTPLGPDAVATEQARIFDFGNEAASWGIGYGELDGVTTVTWPSGMADAQGWAATVAVYAEPVITEVDLAPATEATTAVNPTVEKHVTPSPASEATTGINPTVVKRVDIDAAAAVGEAVNPSVVKRVTLVPAEETATAVNLDIDHDAGTAVDLVAAVETVEAVNVEVTKRVDLAPAVDASEAQALSIVKRVTLIPAVESAAGVSPAVTKRATVTPADSTEEAQSLDVAKRAELAPASEATEAAALTGVKRVALLPASESTQAFNVGVGQTQTVNLDPADETTTAVNPSIRKRVALVPATAVETPVALAIVKRVTLVPALETTIAVNLSVEGGAVMQVTDPPLRANLRGAMTQLDGGSGRRDAALSGAGGLASEQSRRRAALAGTTRGLDLDG